MACPAKRKQIGICQPITAVCYRHNVMNHVSLSDQAAHLAPTAQRILRHVCGPDRLPPSIIPARCSRPASLIMLTLRLMIGAPVAVGHDHAATWLLAIPLTGFVQITITTSDDCTTTGESTESFRGCCHNNTNSSGQHRASNRKSQNSFRSIEKPHKAKMPLAGLR